MKLRRRDIEERAMRAAETLARVLSERSWTAAFAESCTAGLAAGILARVPGASRVLWGSFVCYTAEAKTAMLGLERARLERYGLVSGETARGMALGALEKSGVHAAAAVTGIAGPGGDGSAVPVGTVWTAVALRGAGAAAREFHFSGSRNEVRLQAAAAVLEELLSCLTGPENSFSNYHFNH